MWWAGSPCFHPVNPSHPQTTNYTTSVALYRVCHTFPRITPDRQIAVPSGVGRPHRAAVEQQAPYPPPPPRTSPRALEIRYRAPGAPRGCNLPRRGTDGCATPSWWCGGGADYTTSTRELVISEKPCCGLHACSGGCWWLLGAVGNREEKQSEVTSVACAGARLVVDLVGLTTPMASPCREGRAHG